MSKISSIAQPERWFKERAKLPGAGTGNRFYHARSLENFLFRIPEPGEPGSTPQMHLARPICQSQLR